ncbi:MAG: iron chelate uptake ABC transporter family permease subunit, partial [Methylobacter sp.]|nr:iron chelate uptake ABC transporter family permease subunit [Methylobacter sp.]
TASYEKVATVAIPVLAGGMLMYLMRFRINVMSLGDEDAGTLGISVQRSRWMVLAGVTAITAATVAVAGVIGWVGLVIPHAARMMTGADHRTLLPVSALLGAIYMLIIDSIARSATAMEIPIGILTAIIGAPVFIVLLKRNKLGGWHGD